MEPLRGASQHMECVSKLVQPADAVEVLAAFVKAEGYWRVNSAYRPATMEHGFEADMAKVMQKHLGEAYIVMHSLPWVELERDEIDAIAREREADFLVAGRGYAPTPPAGSTEAHAARRAPST